MTILEGKSPKALPLIGIFDLTFWNPGCIWVAFTLLVPIDAAFIQVGAIVGQWFLVPFSCLAMLVGRILFFTPEYGIVH